MAVLYENDALSILVFSTKKGYSSFLKKIFVFQKICFKVKALKTFTIFTDYQKKTSRPLKRRAILKSPSIVTSKKKLFPAYVCMYVCMYAQYNMYIYIYIYIYIWYSF